MSCARLNIIHPDASLAAGDSIAAPISISGESGSVALGNGSLTTDAGDGDSLALVDGEGTQWIEWTPPRSGTASFSVNSSQSQYIPRISVWRRNGSGRLVRIDSESLDVTVTPSPHFICLMSYSSSTRNTFTWNLSQRPVVRFEDTVRIVDPAADSFEVTVLRQDASQQAEFGLRLVQAGLGATTIGTVSFAAGQERALAVIELTDQIRTALAGSDGSQIELTGSGEVSADYLQVISKDVFPKLSGHVAASLTSDESFAPYWITLQISASGAVTGKLRHGVSVDIFNGTLESGELRLSLANGDTLVLAPNYLDTFSGNRTFLSMTIFRGATVLARSTDLQTLDPSSGPRRLSFYGSVADGTMPFVFVNDVFSFGRIVFRRNGRATMVGVAADGSPMSGEMVVTEGGNFSYYCPLYKGAGFFAGDSAQYTWHRPGNPKSVLFPSGFTLKGDFYTAEYKAPPARFVPSAAIFPRGEMFFNDAVLLRANGSVSAVIFRPEDDNGISRLTLSFDPATGMFWGGCRNEFNAERPITVRFRGILYGDWESGYQGFGSGMSRERILGVKVTR